MPARHRRQWREPVLSDATSSLLPASLLRLFDGESLRQKVGQTAEITSVDDDGWPRTALLSVGELLAASPSRLICVTHSGSRTTRALVSSGRALLLTVLDGVVHKIMLEVRPLVIGAPDELTALDGTVVSWAADEASYARVRHGIEFDLLDVEGVLARWADQIRLLRSAAQG